MRRPGLVLLALLLAGCLEGGGGPPGAASAPVAWRTLAHDTDSGIEEAQRTVLADEDAWHAAWGVHRRSPNPKGPPPEVDFATERAVIVALGEKGSGCHDVRVENVTREGGEVVVHVARYDGEAQGFSCTAVMTQPVHFVAIRDRDGEVTFRERVVRPPEPWAEAEPRAGDAEPLSTRALARGSESRLDEDVRGLVTSRAEWEALWARHGGDGPAPEVEFPNESVVAVVQRGPAGCFGLHVGNVTWDGRAIRVEVVHEATPEGYACLRSLENAYDFVAIPHRDGPVEFEDVEGAPPAEPAGGPDGAAGGEVPLRTLAHGIDGGYREVARGFIETDEAWAEAWSRLMSRRTEPEPLPQVDFATERVLLVSAGERANTCWGIRVERVEETGEGVRATVATYAPDAGRICGQMISAPYHVVAFPATAAPTYDEVAREGSPPNV